MSLTLYQGGMPVRSSIDTFDALFDSLWGGAPTLLPRYKSRIVDDKYTIEVDLPGVKKDDVNATVLSGQVHVKAKRAGKDIAFVVNVPHEFSIDEISASMSEGVLTMAAPRVTGRVLEIL